MNTLIVFDSRHGNTQTIAEEIGSVLGEHGDVRIFPAIDAAGVDLNGIDLLVVGGPTEGHGATEHLIDWLNAVPSDSLKHRAFVAFDTRLHMARWLSGSAALVADKRLRAVGGHAIAPPESFFVHGKQPELLPGERERARAWARDLMMLRAPEARPMSPAAHVAIWR
jgi:hypothetical protein